MRNIASLYFCLFTFLFFSCETDSYEKGEGKYSLTQADLCDLLVDSEKRGTTFITDDGDTYELTKPITAKWMETPDTTYRILLYYNKVSNGKAEFVNGGGISTLQPIEHWRLKEMPQDPIGFESAWISRTGKYLNVGLLIKTGRVDDEEMPHNIGLAQDTVYVRDNGKRTACYRLLHSQNGIPEHYTNRCYVSILLPEQRPDTIRLQIQTYDGPMSIEF